MTSSTIKSIPLARLSSSVVIPSLSCGSSTAAQNVRHFNTTCTTDTPTIYTHHDGKRLQLRQRQLYETYRHRSLSSTTNDENGPNLHQRAAFALGKGTNSISRAAMASGKGTTNSNNEMNPILNTIEKSTEDDKEVNSPPSSSSTNEETTTNASMETEPTPASSSEPSIPPLPQGHLNEFAPRIIVVGVGGAGGNAVNNMVAKNLYGVDFVTLNTDAQHLSTTLTENRLQIGSNLTSGLGCGANPDAGRLAAEESQQQITDMVSDAHMVFITAGMGGGTGTGAAPVVAKACYDLGILTVGVVTKPFRFEGTQRMRLAEEGIERLREVVDTLIVIPNQNLFALADDQTSFVDSFAMADNVLLAGVKSITDLMTSPGLINLDFADVQSVMNGMGNAILGTGQSSNDDFKPSSSSTSSSNGNGNNGGGKVVQERAIIAAEQALANPLLGADMDIGTAKGMLVNITGGNDMTLFEVDRAAQLITERVQDPNANIIFGSAYDESLNGSVRVSVVATGIDESTDS